MTQQWKIWNEPEGLWTVLQHPSGPRAYFSTFRIGEVLAKHGLGRLPDQPFLALAWLVQHGLQPSKFEGEWPADALAAPLQQIEDHS